jgi:hypothetical protein
MVVLVDVLAAALVLGGAAAFALGAEALARAADLAALYWLVAGAVAVRSAVALARPGGAA